MNKTLLEEQVLTYLSKTTPTYMLEDISQDIYDAQEVFFKKCEDLGKKLNLNVRVNNAVANEYHTSATFGNFSKTKDTYAFVSIYPKDGNVSFRLLLNSEKKEDHDSFGKVEQPKDKKIQTDISYPISKIRQLTYENNYRDDFDIDMNKLNTFIREIRKIKM